MYQSGTDNSTNPVESKTDPNNEKSSLEEKSRDKPYRVNSVSFAEYKQFLNIVFANVPPDPNKEYPSLVVPQLVAGLKSLDEIFAEGNAKIDANEHRKNKSS